MILYKVVHIHDINDYIVPDVKCLGYFSTIENAEDAIAFFKLLPGFSSYPNGFIITEHQINYKVRRSKLYVYELVFYLRDRDFDYEYESLLSIHSTLKEATEKKRKFVFLNKKDNTILGSKLLKKVWIESRVVDQMSLFWAEGFEV